MALTSKEHMLHGHAQPQNCLFITGAVSSSKVCNSSAGDSKQELH